jgi:large subunit ribosomal protein L25
METVNLDAKVRDTKITANSLRRAKIIPAICYGKREQSLPLQVDYQVFRRIFLKVGSNQIIDLNIDGKNKKQVLVHDIQYHPLTGAITHVDFLHVNLTEEVTAHVPVEFFGVAPAIKDFGGILTTVKHELTVKCLPMDIPHEIKVDITGLVMLSSSIHVKELSLPKGVHILDNSEDVVVTVVAPRVEEEAAPAAVAVEGAPSAEGAAAAPGAEGTAAPAGAESSKAKDEKK